MTGVWRLVATAFALLAVGSADAAPQPRPSAAVGSAVRDREWTVFRDARLLEDRYFDGDSFHLKPARGAEGVFRLYFADCPETDLTLKDRIAEQAKVFGVPAPRIPEIGKQALEFTRQFLKDGCTVHTKMEVAEGSSRMTRHFAFIEVKGRWLHEALIEAGLARAYGKSIDLPDGTTIREHWNRLNGLQSGARKRHAGAWAAPAR